MVLLEPRGAFVGVFLSVCLSVLLSFLLPFFSVSPYHSIVKLYRWTINVAFAFHDEHLISCITLLCFLATDRLLSSSCTAKIIATRFWQI